MTHDQRTAALAAMVFAQRDHWGWEYSEPAVRPFPEADRRPEWIEPRASRVEVPEVRPLRVLRILHVIARLLASVAILVASFGVVSCGIISYNASMERDPVRAAMLADSAADVLLVGVKLGVAAVVCVVLYRIGESSAVTQWRQKQRVAGADRAAATMASRERDRQAAVHATAEFEWEQRRADHEAQERRRRAAGTAWTAIAPLAQTSLVDVVGGTPAGWAALLTNVAGSAVAEGHSVLFLDLTDTACVVPVLDIARAAGTPVRLYSAPADLDSSWLLGGVARADLASVLTTVMRSVRRESRDPTIDAMQISIFETVVAGLDAPFTVERLTAGLQVLRGSYDQAGGVLDRAEILRLTDRNDLTDRSDQFRDELRFVETVVAGLRPEPDGVRGGEPWDWPARTIGVVRAPAQTWRNDLSGRALVEAVSYHLAAPSSAATRPVVVVVGADEIGRESLEVLARRAQRTGARLVVLFEHLRGAAVELLGGGDSATVMMRVGNGKEAASAAEFIGRGHTFVLSQRSRQHGMSSGRSTSTSTGSSEGRSDGRSSGVSHSHSTTSGPHGGSSSISVGTTWSRSVTRSWTTSETDSTSDSVGRSDTTGEVLQRTYEFTVEPTQLQSLDQNMFLLVDSELGVRRVRMADCSPSRILAARSPAPPLTG